MKENVLRMKRTNKNANCKMFLKQNFWPKNGRKTARPEEKIWPTTLRQKDAERSPKEQ